MTEVSNLNVHNWLFKAIQLTTTVGPDRNPFKARKFVSRCVHSVRYTRYVHIKSVGVN